MLLRVKCEIIFFDSPSSSFFSRRGRAEVRVLLKDRGTKSYRFSIKKFYSFHSTVNIGEQLNDKIWEIYYIVIKEPKAFFIGVTEIIVQLKNSVH